MPQRKSPITVIRELVREEVAGTLTALLGSGRPRRTGVNGRRRRRRRRGPGRPPGSKTGKA